MTDAQLWALLEELPGCPQLIVGRHRYILVGARVLCETRVGKRGHRWAFRPSSDVTALALVPAWWPREVRVWISRARINHAAHAHAMGARTL